MERYLLGLKSEVLINERPDLFGHVLENYVAMQLTKLLTFSDSKARPHHFRTSDGKEVDFILEKPDGNLWEIEVKNSDAVPAKDFNGIKLFEQLTEKSSREVSFCIQEKMRFLLVKIYRQFPAVLWHSDKDVRAVKCDHFHFL